VSTQATAVVTKAYLITLRILYRVMGVTAGRESTAGTGGQREGPTALRAGSVILAEKERHG
jgi:hypothetical protein